MILRGPDDTAALGAQIAARLAQGDAVALEGDLGAGKTVLARALLRALGHQGEVPSPTFTLAQRYETARLVVCHYDLYRIARESELDELALDDALDEGAVLIEWPERAGTRLPQDALHVRLDIVDAETRRVRLTGPAHWAALAPEGDRP
jgi:tRNA threonylcarbamoyl adenosine modification protein YjeE